MTYKKNVLRDAPFVRIEFDRQEDSCAVTIDVFLDYMNRSRSREVIRLTFKSSVVCHGGVATVILLIKFSRWRLRA